MTLPHKGVKHALPKCQNMLPKLAQTSMEHSLRILWNEAVGCGRFFFALPQLFRADGPVECLRLSGFHCQNGRAPTDINQAYLLTSYTSDGRPVFRGQNNQLHIFYDAGCGQTWSGWFVACKAPDLERQWNLQDAASGNCCNYVRFTNTSELQFGTYEMPWKWRNDWAYSGPDTLTLSVCQLPGSFSEAPTPGPESDTETAPNSFTSWPSSFSLLAAVTAVTVMAFSGFWVPTTKDEESPWFIFWLPCSLTSVSPRVSP